MLKTLKINNFALIDTLETEFPEGFSVLTGQTGAGKSIMLGALSLLLGRRADMKSVAGQERKTVVEAEFVSDRPVLSELLREFDIDEQPDGFITMRREILPSGRSRGFINDTPAPLSAMESVGSRLIDIHSQHRNLALAASPELLLSLVDAIAANQELRASYSVLYHEYVRLHGKLSRLRKESHAAEQQSRQDAERLRLLDELRPHKGEAAELEKMIEVLSNASEIKECLGTACMDLSDDECGAIPAIYQALKCLSELPAAALQPELSKRLESALVEVKDICHAIEDAESSVETDNRRLEMLETRLNTFESLRRQFGLPDTDSLAEMYDDLKQRSLSAENKDEFIKELETGLKQRGAELKKQSAMLTETRKKAAKILADSVREAAMPLGLPHLRVEVAIEPVKLSASGADRAEMFCAFNLASDMLPVASTASGGELSRLMLAIKSVMAKQLEMPTVIFDEIDTGLSGEIATRMADLMAQMARSMQVISITHLPQVAARGVAHFLMEKNDVDGRTVSSMKRLSEDEREDEIARMLSGKTIDRAARDNAKSLLNQTKKK